MAATKTKIDTTLGELIAAAGEVAFEYSNNDKEAYQMARLALIEMLRRASDPLDFDEELDSTTGKKFHLH